MTIAIRPSELWPRAGEFGRFAFAGNQLTGQNRIAATRFTAGRSVGAGDTQLEAAFRMGTPPKRQRGETRQSDHARQPAAKKFPVPNHCCASVTLPQFARQHYPPIGKKAA